MTARSFSIMSTLAAIRSFSAAESPPARRALGGVVTAPRGDATYFSNMYRRCVMEQTHSETVDAR